MKSIGKCIYWYISLVWVTFIFWDWRILFSVLLYPLTCSFFFVSPASLHLPVSFKSHLGSFLYSINVRAPNRNQTAFPYYVTTFTDLVVILFFIPYFLVYLARNQAPAKIPWKSSYIRVTYFGKQFHNSFLKSSRTFW